MEGSKRKPEAAVAVRQGKMRRRKIVSTVGALALIVVVIAFIFSTVNKKDDSLSNYATAKVQRSTITRVISATGSVTAQTGAQVRIGSQITGRIKRLYADVGTQVHAGQIIAELDLPDIKAQLDQAVANLELAKVKLTEQESGVGMQQTNVSSDIAKSRAAVDSAQAAYVQAVENARLQVNTAQASVNQAEATNKNAQTLLKRDKQILAKGYIAQQDVDTAQSQADVAAAQLDSAQQNLILTRTKSDTDVRTALNNLENARAALAASNAGTAQNVIKAQQVSEARASVDQAAAQVDYWKAQWDKTVIRSPINGTVLSLDVQQGETIAAGLAAPTLIRVTDLHRLQIDAFVDETDVGAVHIGQPATVTVDAYPNRTFHARVEKIASGATMQQNVVTYDTTLSVENPGGRLKPDMTATVKIVVGEHRNVLSVPIEAVKNAQSGQVVYVLKGDKVITQPVVTGISDDTKTEIIRGLHQGDTVILAGYSPQGQAGGPGGMRMTPFGPMGGHSGGGHGGGRGH